MTVEENSTIIQILYQLLSRYKKIPSLSFKSYALSRAVYNIRQYDKVIKSGDDAKFKIPTIGKGIAKRIDEILKTGTLIELEEKIGETTLDKFVKITGLGEVKAQGYVDQGITSIKEFKELSASNEVKVSKFVKIGLKYYEDFQIKIPRDEIDIVNRGLKKMFKKKWIEK